MADFSRRRAIKLGTGAAGLVAFTRAAWPLVHWAENLSIEEVLQAHYKELNRGEMEAILRRIERDTKEEYGVEVDVNDPRPTEGVKFAYALNLSMCIGCRRCAEACHKENNHDRSTSNAYIRVLELEQGSMSLDNALVNYDHEVPAEGKYYMPVQCHQCDKPPCVKVCPVEATFKDEDGIVVVDYNWCIGCRYCQAACPYHARRFNWHKPVIPPEEINPDQGYLSNRIRPVGAMEKCTFCLHRTRVGRLPACLEACPTGSRVFGNLADPESGIRWLLENKRVYVLKEDLGTHPSFFYFFDK